MARHLLLIFLTFLMVGLSTQFWGKVLKKEEKTELWDQLSVELPDLYNEFKVLPLTRRLAEWKGWRKTDRKQCDGHQIFRGNRYRYKNEGTMLLFDSNGHIAGVQAAIPTTVPMVSKWKKMMPIENGRYHLTIYFTDPETICNAPKRNNKIIGDRFLIQMGATWKKTMNVPISERKVKKTAWIEGSWSPRDGTHYWYNVSKKMDCEDTFPVFVMYSSKGKLHAFGWSIKGYFDDPKFSHPPSILAFLAFNKGTLPECIEKANTQGSVQQFFLQSASLNHETVYWFRQKQLEFP